MPLLMQVKPENLGINVTPV